MISGSAACAVMMWALAQAGAPPEVPPAAEATQPQPEQPAPPPPDVVSTEPAQEEAESPSWTRPPPTVTPPPAPEPAAEQPAAEAPADASRKPKPTRRTYLRRPNTMSVNLAKAVFGSYTLVLERALSHHFSLVLEPGVVQRQFETTRGTTQIAGFAFAVSGRFFLLGGAPDGLFVSPEFNIFNLAVREAAGRDNGTTMAGGVWAGYNHTFWNLLHLSGGVGWQVAVGKVTPEGILYRGIGGAPLYRVNVGLAF